MKQQYQFIECPDSLPGIEFGEPRLVQYERTVVCSDFFGPALPFGRIVMQHQQWFRPVRTTVRAHLVLARVAGYREAVYGLPEETFPILFEHPDYPGVLISAMKLSCFREARFCPREDWQIIIGRIRAFLKGKNGIEPVPWKLSVGPSYGKDELLPPDAELQAFDRNDCWFRQNIFFSHSVGTGVFEGFRSGIDEEGHQSPAPQMRGDCTGEASMIPAISWQLHRNPGARRQSIRILENLFASPELADICPDSPTYGGVNFYQGLPIFYSDDNCRAFMCAVLASELTGNFTYAENILRGMMMILRSCGKKGFRRPRLDNPGSFEGGMSWKDYGQEDYVLCSPHRQAYMWAGFLQVYALTSYREFYEKAETGLRIIMEVFPKLNWTNGITQEYARLVLPLAFLVEIQDTPEHRNWLRIVCDKLLESWQPCGAVAELTGTPEDGRYPAPQSNEQYGTTEAPLIQQNGDPVCDLLYTQNFAFIGFYEAAMATGEDYYWRVVRKMSDFLCRIQVDSQDQPGLSGCWMRGFDFNLWEYYASSADIGWGAWCVESGWTNNWIAGTLGLMLLRRPMLCRQSAAEYQKIFPEVLKDMSEVRHCASLKQKSTFRAPGAE